MTDYENGAAVIGIVEIRIVPGVPGKIRIPETHAISHTVAQTHPITIAHTVPESKTI